MRPESIATKFMPNKFKKTISAVVVLCLLGVIVYDSRYHFDKGLIHLKRQHKSAQKNWNLFYGQQYVFTDSGFRYEADFTAMKGFIDPRSAVLSDISTSYYMSTYLPVYIKNIHRHHGRYDSNGIASYLNSRQACYLQDPKNIALSKTFFKKHNALMKRRGLAEIRYIVVNRDVKNLNLRQDCLWTSHQRLLAYLDKLATLKYTGQYLSLFEINKF